MFASASIHFLSVLKVNNGQEKKSGKRLEV